MGIREYNKLLGGFQEDRNIKVTRGDDLKAWTINATCKDDWNISVNGGSSQDGSIDTEFFISQEKQNSVEFKVQIKITFEEDKMDVNVRGENEYFVGNFIGNFVKLSDDRTWTDISGSGQ